MGGSSNPGTVTVLGAPRNRVNQEEGRFMKGREERKKERKKSGVGRSKTKENPSGDEKAVGAK